VNAYNDIARARRYTQASALPLSMADVRDYIELSGWALDTALLVDCVKMIDDDFLDEMRLKAK